MKKFLLSTLRACNKDAIFDVSFLALATESCLLQHTVDEYMEHLINSQYGWYNDFGFISVGMWLCLDVGAEPVCSKTSSPASRLLVMNAMNDHKIVLWPLYNSGEDVGHYVLAVIYARINTVALVDSSHDHKAHGSIFEVSYNLEGIISLLSIYFLVFAETSDFLQLFESQE